jgi:hypothetical protein
MTQCASKVAAAVPNSGVEAPRICCGCNSSGGDRSLYSVAAFGLLGTDATCDVTSCTCILAPASTTMAKVQLLPTW